MTPAGPARDPAVLRMVHAVLMPGFTGTSVPGWLARAIEEDLGAVLYFAPNLTGDAAELSGALHGTRPGLLVASDEEGGSVTRLHAQRGSPHPGHGELGAAGDPRRTRTVAAELGRELRAAGIDIGIAPVVDVNVDPANPVIGERSFGSDAGEVARHGAAFVEGLQSAGVAATAKHFPGHGDTTTDSHLALPVIDIDQAVLRDRELVPFAAAIGAGVRTVMAGHIRIPALDSAPASVSPRAYALLRTELGFTGAALTDALDMRAMAEYFGSRTALEGLALGAVAALHAGADLLCLGNPYQGDESDETIFLTVRDRILAALADGSVPLARLAEAAGRVAELAAWCRHRGGR
ncbi:beta-N-acetylhexosaminidase [Spinactinospora alkalitolerans]|uniref:Beta-N-acetylhexosaminidase n=1 Tax=Spinactinospora alkalitolerans TaxID=687207 RepID=A0A852TUF2_9ACTN|nr:glycoside hydrolase family 3 N-terminal domain-containing protein [Spinactinospora alkalitolerans]NYE46403.1 beta-N-acetylhexosaminidase [Spinactinospora alkalitolerans]